MSSHLGKSPFPIPQLDGPPYPIQTSSSFPSPCGRRVKRTCPLTPPEPLTAGVQHLLHLRPSAWPTFVSSPLYWTHMKRRSVRTEAPTGKENPIWLFPFGCVRPNNQQELTTEEK